MIKEIKFKDIFNKKKSRLIRNAILKHKYILKETEGWDNETYERYLPQVEEHFIDYFKGFSAKEKIIKDLYNKYNSQLKDEEYVKLTKTINTEKVNRLKIKLETLKELL